MSVIATPVTICEIFLLKNSEFFEVLVTFVEMAKMVMVKLPHTRNTNMEVTYEWTMVMNGQSSNIGAVTSSLSQVCLSVCLISWFTP